MRESVTVFVTVDRRVLLITEFEFSPPACVEEYEIEEVEGEVLSEEDEPDSELTRVMVVSADSELELELFAELVDSAVGDEVCVFEIGRKVVTVIVDKRESVSRVVVLVSTDEVDATVDEKL